MLSAAKVRIHGMQDENWMIKDKITQYRGLIKLYERDRKIYDTDLAKQKRRYSRDIRQLRKDIEVKRKELGVAVYGDKQFLRNAFQEHRRLQLTFMNSQAHKVLEDLNQANFNKRKKLDRISYAKKKKMEKFRNLQLRMAEIEDRLIYESNVLATGKAEQATANNVQRANIKKNAALVIKVMYKKILDILKKDSSYFTSVLEALKQDCRTQGKCLMGATEMGQLAMEYLDDRKYEYKKLEQEIKMHMKERISTLKLVKREVAYLTASFPKIITKEEATNLDDLYEEEDTGSQHSVHWELEEVKGICRRLQRATLVPSFEKILPRLKEQTYQMERLNLQLTLNSLKRDELIESRKHALLMLDSLKNVGQERTALYLQEKTQLKANLETERKQQQNLTQKLHEKGKLIIEMKTSLQQINELLQSVGVPNVPLKSHSYHSHDSRHHADELQPVPVLEADFDELLSTIKKKLTLLMQAIANMQVTDTMRLAAKNFYHNIFAQYLRDSFKEEVVAEGGLIEFEVEDPNVPSYAVVKLRSKQLVDAQVSEFDVPDTKK